MRRTLLASLILGCLAVPTMASADAMYNIGFDSGGGWSAYVALDVPPNDAFYFTFDLNINSGATT